MYLLLKETGHHGQRTPRLLGWRHTDAKHGYAFLEWIPAEAPWPWPNLDCSLLVVEELAALHRTHAPAHLRSALVSWDYERELVESAHSTLAMERLVASLPRLRRELLAFTGTALLHGDAHPGNVVLTRRAGKRRAVFIDWARASLGSPLEDLSSWVHSLALWEPEARRRHDSLLRRYVTASGNAAVTAAQFLAQSRRTLDHFESHAQGNLMTSEEQQAAVHALEEACEKVQPPLHRMEHALHPWVTFFTMPVFALANAGVVLGGNVAEVMVQPVTLGVILGLVFGKPLGITLAAWIAVRAGIASLPTGVTWRHIHGAGWLGGIAFTMSLFVASLAFTGKSLLTMAKLGILTASVLAAVVGSVFLVRTPRTAAVDEAILVETTK